MKLQSAAEAKGYHVVRDLTAPPKAGSARRALYDLLFDNKGRIVDVRSVGFKNTHMRAQALEALRDTYGLDIRQCPGKYRFMLVGEWCGRIYVDYLAEKIDEDARNPVPTDRWLD